MVKEIKKLIEAFEDGQLEMDNALARINQITGKSLSAYELKNYWRSTSLDDFIRGLCLPTIQDWSSLAEADALKLIQEIFENDLDDALCDRNSLALEKRFGKPSGTISELAFGQELTPDQILEKLKVDTTLNL